MLKDLLAIILTGGSEDEKLGDDFLKMLDLAEEMFREVNVGIWGGAISAELLDKTYRSDVRLNKLERSIRKRALNRLAVRHNTGDIPYCYVLINVVKDAERIGDYVKNLAEVERVSTLDIPDGEIREGVRTLAQEVEKLLGRVAKVFDESIREEAAELVRHGRGLAKSADELLPKIAQSSYSCSAVTSLVLMTRFYKRIASHTTNILSSVIMPLHKIDYFDEGELSLVSS